MNTFESLLKDVIKYLAAIALIVCSVGAPWVAADESAPFPELDVWFNNAPTDVVVREVAALSGRTLVTDEPIEGQISGKFSGSLPEILSAIAEQQPMLFDIDETNLSVANSQSRTVTSIVINEKPIDAATRESLETGLLPGNQVSFLDSEALVSGHPVFVRRTTKTITAALASDVQNQTEPPVAEQSTAAWRAKPSTGLVVNEVASETSSGAEVSSAEAASVADTQTDSITTETTTSANEKKVNEQASEVAGKYTQEAQGLIDTAKPDATAGTERVIVDLAAQESAVAMGQSTDETDEQVAAAVSQDIVDEDKHTLVSDVATSISANVSEQEPPVLAEPNVEEKQQRFRWVTDIPGFDTF